MQTEQLVPSQTSFTFSFKPVNMYSLGTAMDIALGDGAITDLRFVESGPKDWLLLQVCQVLWEEQSTLGVYNIGKQSGMSIRKGVQE